MFAKQEVEAKWPVGLDQTAASIQVCDKCKFLPNIPVIDNGVLFWLVLKDTIPV